MKLAEIQEIKGDKAKLARSLLLSGRFELSGFAGSQLKFEV